MKLTRELKTRSFCELKMFLLHLNQALLLLQRLIIVLQLNDTLHKNLAKLFSVTNNYVLPAGATVVIGTFRIHRNPKYYKNPNVFDPDNFLPEKTQDRHYYSYVPFSAGPRSCVGEYLWTYSKGSVGIILKLHTQVPNLERSVQKNHFFNPHPGLTYNYTYYD